MTVLAGVLALLFSPAASGEPQEKDRLDAYNVVWTTPSANSSESMPVGGHSIGLNVWVEKGELLFYAQRSGSFDENNEYLKLGRFRIRLDPNPFENPAGFRQELKLREGYVRITAGEGEKRVTVDVWVEAHRPVVHVDLESAAPIATEAIYETWRFKDVELPNENKGARFGCFSYEGYLDKIFRRADTVKAAGDSILFHHRADDKKLVFDVCVEVQGLEPVREKLVNTQKGRTFGGLLAGKGFSFSGTTEGTYQGTDFRGWKLKSSPAKRHRLKLLTHVAQTDTLEAWLKELSRLAGDATVTDDEARSKTLEWWNDFWERSWLIINPGKPDPESPVWQVGRNYQLFRYQLGCNAFGEYPSKFNGGNFTYDPVLVSKRRQFAPDWRAWGGGSFTAQNQRLLYWPMLKTGDYEEMLPQLEFYRRALPSAVARVKHYWGHEGCLFTEQMENFGLPLAMAWGWPKSNLKHRLRSEETEHGVQTNRACCYHYEAQVEFAYMVLEYFRYSGRDISPYLDFVKQSVRFFDAHYQMRKRKRDGSPLDKNGKLVIFPSTACESFKGATNPTDLVSGLTACLSALLTLPEKYVSEKEQEYYRGYLERLPGYGYEEVDGLRMIKPAWSWERSQNCEIPEFYPLFPFNRFELGKDDLSAFVNRYTRGKIKKGLVISWHQDGIFLARMGLTKEAAAYNTKKMQDSDRRFPTFWGPGHDWVPDHNWGGSGMIGVQEMLMQSIGDTIRLLPAWPKEWDVDFKLHAPGKTVLVGSVRGGKVVDLEVTPASRRRDVVLPE